MSETPSPPGPPHDDEPRTVFMPSGGMANAFPPAPPPPSPSPSEPPRDQPREQTGGGFQTQFAPRTDGRGIQVGDVLNHIFEVKRFIARGGMGEVFEGANVNSDERVAIKVMLPSLAADPNVIGMFRKEARTLTRLQHEALVQYRVLAQEPQLGVLYIVTEYVDGVNLADVLGQQRPTAADLIMLLRRLASGLRAAHQLGAIHRDIAPDNVLLEGGILAGAKIIDFGIAKDLDPGSKTIVGDGFAGKLNYVAPEQLGDFGREVGPWTDVYSLALVILAVAMGKNVPMGGSLVDAVDKRRAGPDLSGAPEEIRPVLAKMVAPNPADRLRSMDEVLAELEPKVAPVPPVRSNSKIGLLIGAGVGAVALVGAALLFTGRGNDGSGTGTTVPVVAADPVEVTRGTINSTLPSVQCTWLDIARVEKAGDRIAVSMTGVAGNPTAAMNEISRALTGRKVENADINFDAVSPITPSGCAALDAYRQIRSPDGRRLSAEQTKFELRMQGPEEAYAGELAANGIINLNPGTADFTMLGIEPSGVITGLFPNRADFEQKMAASGGKIAKIGDNRFRLELDSDHVGWSGILLVTGKGPFDGKLVGPPLGARGPDWLDKFVSAAAQGGWQTDMVWYKQVDEVRE